MTEAITYDFVAMPEEREGGCFILKCSPRLNDRVQLIPSARYSKATDSWIIPATLSAALIARAVFGEALQPTGANYGWVARLLELDRTFQVTDSAGPAPMFDTGRALPFQVPSIAAMAARGWVFQFDDRGNGKSVQTAIALENLKGPALIVCTASMLHVWGDELAAHAPTRTPYILSGTKPQRAKQLAAAREDERAVVVCTWKVLTTHSRLKGYGSVKLTEAQSAPKELNGGWIQHVIADEAHKAKDPKAQQTRALWAVGHEATGVRIPMTATPIADSAADLWALLHFVDPLSWPSRTKFRDRYVHTFMNGWGGVEDLGFNMNTKPELDRVVGPRVVRRPLQLEVKALPPQVRWLDMPAKQAKAYKAMKQEMMAEVEGGVLIAANALTRDMRLHQIAAATPEIEEFYDEEGRLRHKVARLLEPSCKYDALVDLLDEQGKDDPLVVFAESRKLIELCYRTLTGSEGGKVLIPQEQVGLITGSVSNEARAAHVRAYQGGEQRLMLATIGAGSEGLTLTRGNTLVFLQRSYREIANIQAEGRVLRHGQERDVQVIDFVTRGTIEEDLHKATADKSRTMQQFLNDPEWVERTLS